MSRPIRPLVLDLAYHLLEETLHSPEQVARLMVLVEQSGAAPWMSTALMMEYLERTSRGHPSHEWGEVWENAKARLQAELYPLRKRGKPVRLMTEDEYMESVYGAPGEDDRDDQWWNEGSDNA
jgi:hypothetical protein